MNAEIACHSYCIGRTAHGQRSVATESTFIRLERFRNCLFRSQWVQPLYNPCVRRMRRSCCSNDLENDSLKIRFGCSSFAVLAFLLPLMPSASIAQSVPPQPVVLATGWQLQDVSQSRRNRAPKSPPRPSKPPAGTRPPFPAPYSPRWSTTTSTPSRSTAKTIAPRSIPESLRPHLLLVSHTDRRSQRPTTATTSGSTSTASTTPPTVWVNGVAGRHNARRLHSRHLRHHRAA